MVHTYAKGSQRRRAIKHSTGAFAIVTRPGVCETSKQSRTSAQSVRNSALPLYRKYRRKQPQRGVPASLIVSRDSDRPPSDRFRNSHWARGSSLSVSRQRGSDHRMPEERGEKSKHNNAKDKTLLVESRGDVAAGGQAVGIAQAKLLGRPPASRPHQTLIKIS